MNSSMITTKLLAPSDEGVRSATIAPGDDIHTQLRDPKRRPRAKEVLNDVVSANCSPTLNPANGPCAISGISMLRLKMESLSLDTSRHNSLSYRSGVPTPSTMVSRSTSRDGSEVGSDGYETGSTSYEISLENDFVSEEVAPKNCDLQDTYGASQALDVPETPVVGGRKMTADDFEPLRCLGKGSYGTVILVKQRKTGRLYAQKQLKKASLVVHKKLVEQTKTERQILESVNRHPFVVKLYYAFQDHEKLYLILEYGQGGELFTYLSTEKMFSEPVAAFYMAEMILAISHLHDNLGVIYRDLKPENCLLDAEGHLLLTDFGLSKVSVDPSDACNSMLGTIDYMAPEIVLGKKYGKAVDWWSLGALGYDLLTGNPPFRGSNNAKIMENITKQKLSLPYFLSADAKNLLLRLLKKDPTKRLGANMPKDLKTLKAHRFFRKLDWKQLEARESEPPIQPFITDPELAENFDPKFTEMCLSPIVSRGGWDAMPSSPRDRDNLFRGFSFVASSSLLDNDWE